MTGPTDRAAEQRHQREQDAHRAARARKTAARAARQRAAIHAGAQTARSRAHALDHLLARERRDLACEVAQRRAELARLERLMTARPTRRG